MTEPVDLEALEKMLGDVFSFLDSFPGREARLRNCGPDQRPVQCAAAIAELKELRETTILLRQENKFLEKEIDQLRERAKDLE